jgi:hypothetical protein
VEKDPKVALALFKKCADCGDALGMYYLGEAYRVMEQHAFLVRR